MIRPLYTILLALLVQNITTLALPHRPARKMPTAQDVIRQLHLSPHPEKGWYIQTFEDPDKTDNRSHSTAIYYLLEGKDDFSNWHRVTDATEIWHYYGGAPLQLSLSYDDGGPVRDRVLGPDIFNKQAPQIVVWKGEWQRAKSLGDWTLVGTTVAPGFTSGGFEMAKPGWKPNGASSE